MRMNFMVAGAALAGLGLGALIHNWTGTRVQAQGTVKQILGPYSAATNHADDLFGNLDPRPSTWGRAEVVLHRMEFHPPAGYRTRILEVYGDVQGWIRAASNGCTGVLWALQSTAPEGSERVTPAADNTFLYVQNAFCQQSSMRAPVHYETPYGGLLEPDNILVSKVATYLNETTQPVHVESSFTVIYQFEK